MVSMSRDLVLVHGRSQQGKDPAALKAEWVGDLRAGMSKAGLDLDVDEHRIHFPFYGDTLDKLAHDVPPADAPEVIIMGPDGDGNGVMDEHARAFVVPVLQAMCHKLGATDADIAADYPGDVTEMGPENWPWVRALLHQLAARVPGADVAAVALATYDVYCYISNSAMRSVIDKGVADAMSMGRDSVVVAHSLGTVVAYNVLESQGVEKGWTVPEFITVGCPLAIGPIKRALRDWQREGTSNRWPACVGEWFNAFDPVDVVALYPLDPTNFPLDPDTKTIDNKDSVVNTTSNHHGIIDYLGDPDVARHIYDALTRG